MKAIMTVLALALISFNTWAIDATHGMVLFGTHKLMAYHLPMFHNIHAKQVVFQYTIPDEAKAQLLAFQDEDFLTFVPEKFDLEKFLIKPFPLKGDVYKGHFEKDGVLVMSDITLENVEVLYTDSISKNPEAKDQYKFFGNPSDLYAVHMLGFGGIEKDHIVKVSANLADLKQVSAINDLITYQRDLFSDKGLFVDGTVNTFTVMAEPVGCHLRWCGPSYITLNLKMEKTIFSDDVM